MKYLIFIFLFKSTHLFGQSPNEPEGITLFKVEVKEYFSPVQPSGGYHPFGSSYKGTLKKAIANAWNFPLTRFRFNGEPPLKYVSFEALSSINPNNARLLVQQNMQKCFKFTLTEETDSIEMWIIHKIDTIKLIPFSYEYHPYGMEWGPCEYGDFWEGIGAPISKLAAECERKSGVITFFEEDDSGYYLFDIPYDVMQSFEQLNTFFRKYNGLEMTKEKRLVTIKYVNFE